MLRKTVLSLKSPTGAFIAPLRCANANLFNKVQEKLAKNKKAPARHKAEESYLLTTKLYCGKCGALMFGESGVSHTGKMYTYYKCAAAKKKKTCDKKAVRKQWLEDQRKELQARIAEERLAKPKMKEEFVRFWLLRFRKLDMTQPEQRQALVDTFINAIYLYDDKVLITFNYKEGTETVAFGEAVKAEKSSDMSARGAPQQQNPNFFPIGEGFGFFVFFGKQNESLASIEKRPRPYHKLLRWITTKIEPCQQKLLKTRHLRQLARKHKGNFGKKREDRRKKGFNYKKENLMK